MTLARRMCFVIYVYGDDGSDEKHERAIAVSVIAGYEDWWKELEDKWLERCGGIPFNAKERQSSPCGYERVPQGPNKAMYTDIPPLLVPIKLGGQPLPCGLAAPRNS